MERRERQGRDWGEGLQAHQGLKEDKTGLAVERKESRQKWLVAERQTEERWKKKREGEEGKEGYNGGLGATGELEENKSVPVEARRRSQTH